MKQQSYCIGIANGADCVGEINHTVRQSRLEWIAAD